MALAASPSATPSEAGCSWASTPCASKSEKAALPARRRARGAHGNELQKRSSINDWSPVRRCMAPAAHRLASYQAPFHLILILRHILYDIYSMSPIEINDCACGMDQAFHHSGEYAHRAPPFPMAVSLFRFGAARARTEQGVGSTGGGAAKGRRLVLRLSPAPLRSAARPGTGHHQPALRRMEQGFPGFRMSLAAIDRLVHTLPSSE
jgi:hypothetical protein